MYCLQCRCVTETENITAATSNNGILMRRGQCITCVKLRFNLLKEELVVYVFLILLTTNSLSKCIYQEIILLVRNNSIKD